MGTHFWATASPGEDIVERADDACFPARLFEAVEMVLPGETTPSVAGVADLLMAALPDARRETFDLGDALGEETEEADARDGALAAAESMKMRAGRQASVVQGLDGSPIEWPE